MNHKVVAKFIKTHITVFVLFTVSLVLIFPYLKEGFIIGSGEIPYLIEPNNARFFYIWNDKVNYGGFSSIQSAIVFYSFVWKIFGFAATQIHQSVIFAFLAFFLPGLFFYILLDKLLKFENRLIYLPPSLLFSFNIFRISASYSNTNLNLLFIFLPLLFLFYVKLLNTKNLLYMFGIVALSFLSSSMGGNLAVESISYLLMGLYLVYRIFIFEEKNVKWLLIVNVLLVFLILIINIFWLVPLGVFLESKYSSVGNSLWSALAAGTFFDHIRFMGFWAFRSGYGGKDYFPFFRSYYSPPMVLSTFAITFLIFFHLFFRSNSLLINKRIKYLRGFVIVVMVVSLTLVIGAKDPFGSGYSFLYNNIPPLKIYREPYAKFMPLFVFAASLSLAFSLKIITDFIRSKLKKTLMLILISLVVLINVFPLFTGQAIFVKRWNQGPAGSITVIPEYWKAVVIDLDKINSDEKIAVSPHNSYVSKYNWEYGVNVVGNIADYLSRKEYVKSWDRDSSNVAELLREAYKNNLSDIRLSRLLGLLNIRYVLQENDIEWRYTPNIYAPSIMNNYLTGMGLSSVENYGKFDVSHLDKLLNEEIDADLKNEFYYELINEPILTLYQTNGEYFLPHFYIPKSTSYAVTSVENLPEVINLSGADEARTNFFITSENVNEIVLNDSEEIIVFGDRLTPPPVDLIGRVWNDDWNWPKTSVNPSSFLGKLVRYKELIELKREKDIFEKVDKLVWFSAKRAFELRGFEISESEKEKLIEESLSLNLEAIEQMKGMKFEKEKIDDYWRKAYKLSMYFERTIYELEEEQAPKELLDPLYFEFNNYQKWIEGNGYLKRPQYAYNFDIPKAGKYTLVTKEVNVWNEKKVLEVGGNENIARDLSDELITDHELITRDGLDEGSSTILIEISEWKPFSKYKISFDFIVRRGEIFTAVLEDVPDYGFFGGYVQNDLWSELKNEKVPVERKQIFDRTLDFSRMCFEEVDGKLTRRDESCYSQFEKIVSSSPKSTKGYLHIRLPLESSELAFADVKNIRISEFNEPKVVLKANDLVDPEVLSTPKINFKKISPTKYFVTVRGAVDPYTLVFIENFHSGWKLRLIKDEDRNYNLIKRALSLVGINNLSDEVENTKDTYSYFDGDIVEGPHSTEFFESNILGAIRQEKIADDKHFVANGFANAWYIEPEDVDNNENYELVVEFMPQKYFYVGIVLSSLVFLISLIAILIILFKKEFEKV